MRSWRKIRADKAGGPAVGRRQESGYALLAVVFLAAVMVVLATTAAPSLITQGRREREEELIWRGEQYARAVRLFYRKNGRFPQTMDDLTKPQNNVRYMRQAYKDPMNTEDGSWRMIYIGPGGQLVGSLMRTSAVQIPGATPASALAAGAQPTPTGATVTFGGAAPVGQRGQPGPGGSSTGIFGGGGIGQPQRDAPQPGSGPGQPQSIGPATRTDSEGRIVGGNIIGVGSKVRKPSIRIYKGGESYRFWEFIWDPVADAAAAGAVAPGAAPGTRPGTFTPSTSPMQFPGTSRPR